MPPNKSVQHFVYKYADKFRLDPKAVLAVASREGGIKWGGVGDGNTSFGPWQLHIGGALPKEFGTPERGAAFANSEAGVRYAMRKMMESGAGGLSGAAAIDTIVRKFERPRADLVEGEIKGAIEWYKGNKGAGSPRLDSDLPSQVAAGEPTNAGSGADVMRASLIARVMENNAATAAGKPGQPITAQDYLTMLRQAKAQGTSGMSDNQEFESGGKHKSGKGIVNPLATKMGSSSEFNVADAEGAHSDEGRFHAAKDWFAPAGTSVVSPEGGKIVEVRPNKGKSGQVFGGTVKVQAPSGRVYVFRHVAPGNVKVGQSVKAGQQIAGVAEWTDGSEHAHIEIWKTLSGGYNKSNMIDPSTVFHK